MTASRFSNWVDDARLEAELLLRHALGVCREQLFVRLQEPMPAGIVEHYDALLTRRLAREPSAYITGHREFYGLDFACSPDALIPRPETELLVETAIAWTRRRAERNARTATTLDPLPLLADIGTGCGAIAVALAVHLPGARIVASDTSSPALRLARQNAETHGVADRIDLIQMSLLSGLRGRFDLIVANLPYIPSRTYSKLPPEIREHEPPSALRAGRRGTALIEALL
ncbi:MAG: peptide chain release factor N(5)-glutamine methyltransferase, partial [Proteobacteria bacterium]|nr:peptide chain release factor N(5)-glutamine methyltransferase [Pseudomonadota bacterium]